MALKKHYYILRLKTFLPCKNLHNMLKNC